MGTGQTGCHGWAHTAGFKESLVLALILVMNAGWEGEAGQQHSQGPQTARKLLTWPQASGELLS